MTGQNNGISEQVFQTFLELRDSVDAISCAAYLIPCGGEGENIGRMFRVLVNRVESDLTAHLNALSKSRS
ncbi:hypothetical protein E1676_00935 [Salmonella enterica subsp. enterica serovar Beaudesert]|nr:hypothetical protein [Salmonella enterica]ECF2427160.1 hypothetical protein [Salmonella enterica subsp. enterica serovar Beaudesert]EAZ4583428.1 hypothetical protein [Salmonella enterica]EBK4143297.1 hypothetical protein [Salmonella enterica]EBP0787737.1 hypothetical protein [Salmonella enterica]